MAGLNFALLILFGVWGCVACQEYYVIVRQLVGTTQSQKWIFKNFSVASTTPAGAGLVKDSTICQTEHDPCSEIGTCIQLNDFLVNCSCPHDGYRHNFTATRYGIVNILDGRTRCDDINECAKKEVCGNHSLACTNTPGSFSCHCKTGYEPSPDKYCQDIDECKNATHYCGSHVKTCQNTDGWYKCYCSKGFDFSNNVTCEDTDECKNDTLNDCDNVNGYCNNTVGSYKCSCKHGYVGDGVNCTDFNECLHETNICGNETLRCINTNGSYTCDCESGFRLNESKICVDADECSTKTDSCSANAKCTNRYGNYKCTCDEGYQGNGYNCTDIDECKTNSHMCHTNATCHNYPGRYYCQCNYPMAGNGTTCTDPCITKEEGEAVADALQEQNSNKKCIPVRCGSSMTSSSVFLILALQFVFCRFVR